MPPAPSPRGRRAASVALGVLATVLLVVCTLVFVAGRHTFWYGEGPVIHDPRHDAQRDLVKTATSSAGGSLDKEKSTAVALRNAADAMAEMAAKYAPTREMVQGLQQGGYLVVTWANWHYQDLVMTWVARVKSVGITGYLVGAMDHELLKALVDRNVNTFSMRSGPSQGDFGWGTPAFHAMCRDKVRMLGQFLKMGVSVVMTDVDVMWLRNPLPFFERFTEADILSSSDQLSSTVKDESLETWPKASSAAANTGITLFRAKSLDLVNEWIKITTEDANVWDQDTFNALFRRGTQTLEDPKHYFKAYQGTLTMGLLPVASFCSGHSFFIQRLYEEFKLQPYAVHATFQFSGLPGKRHRLRESMLFEDPPSYYASEAGFLTFQMDGLEALLRSGGPRTGKVELANILGHFDLVNHQIKRLRNALAIAGLLGRALVVPELWCGLDRWWAPHSGIIPGSELQLPYKCPMDHIFDLESGWTVQMPEDQFGPNVAFRESSFFKNPRTPAAVRDSKVVVEMCAAGSADCSDGSGNAAIKGGKLRVQQGLQSAQLMRALQPVKSFKVVEFNTMANAFGNFTDAGDWSRFAERLKQYGSIWCCIRAKPAGHIHYDMLWDVPHVDKFNRGWNGTWEILPGP